MAGEYEQAMEAFNALESDPSAHEGNQPTPPVEPVEPSQPAAPSAPAPAEPASSTIDISGLPEEAQLYIRARERELTGDYTRKTQEIAAQRQEAAQAMQFLEALNSDPEFAFQVLNHLQSNLASAGYQVAPEETEQYDEYGQPVGPDPYAQEINELQNWRGQMEEQWLEANLSAQLDRQLSVVQQQHPDWTQDDLQEVIDLGFATNGDLMAAAQQYQAVQDRALTRYLEKKGSVNTPAAVPPGSPAQQEPFQPKTEKELHSAALEYVKGQLS
jgi:hypothetical protein